MDKHSKEDQSDKPKRRYLSGEEIVEVLRGLPLVFQDAESSEEDSSSKEKE